MKSKLFKPSPWLHQTAASAFETIRLSCGGWSAIRSATGGERMGLDATIKRADGEPLGPVVEVQRVLATAFPGIVLGRLPSGAEKIRAAAERGVVFPDVIRQHLESAPAQYGGEYEGPDFSAQFNLGAEEVVQQVDVVLYGTTAASEPMFAKLERECGWVTKHP